MSGYFCAIFGAILGWFQIHNERPRDLWAFLVHRPVTRTQIFFAKIIAGLVLYLLVDGPAVDRSLVWALAPGHVAAPFEWAMLRPVAVFFLSGHRLLFCRHADGPPAGALVCQPRAGFGRGVLFPWRSVTRRNSGRRSLHPGRRRHPRGRRLGRLSKQRFLSGPAGAGPAGTGRHTRAGVPVVVGIAAVCWSSCCCETRSAVRIYRMTKDGTIYKITQQEGKPRKLRTSRHAAGGSEDRARPEWADFNRHVMRTYSNKYFL